MAHTAEAAAAAASVHTAALRSIDQWLAIIVSSLEFGLAFLSPALAYSLIHTHTHTHLLLSSSRWRIFLGASNEHPRPLPWMQSTYIL